MIDKPTLRRQQRARRDAAPRHGPIPAPPAFTARLRPDMTVASYAPIGSEAEPAVFEAAALTAHCRLALPYVVDRATPLCFLAWSADALLAPGPFGLRNPPRDAPEAAPDVILTPLLAFDRRGHRLGQGAGHYDRAFARYPAAWRIGIAWSTQEIDAVPTDPWDVPLHAVATERNWIVAR